MHQPKPSILLISENPEMRELVQSILIPKYDIVPANNLFLGIETANISAPTLVILDVRKQVEEEKYLMNQMQNQLLDKNIPILFLATKSFCMDIFDNTKLTSLHTLIKPFYSFMLLSKVAGILYKTKDSKNDLKNKVSITVRK